ncbi:MAG: efflux RND transporter periplasmic adaptor subunit [Micavibrio sp.]
MKKIIILTIIISGLLGAGWFSGAGRFFAASKDVPENIYVVETGAIESVVTAQGTLEPKEYVEVGAQVSGLVKKLHVEIGDSVAAGDLIAEIDPAVYEAQVKASEAELKVLQAQKAEQQSLVKQAEQKYGRNQNLIKDFAISKEVLEDSRTDLAVARAKLTSLMAQIEKAESTLEGNRTNLSYTKIYAPMEGTVVSQSVKEGQTINANQTAPVIVEVANLSIMTAKAQVAEADISKISEGMDVYFTTLGSRNRKWDGTVRQILPTPDTINDVVLYNVLVDSANDDGRLMTNMTTQMFFVLGRADNVPLIPVSALQKRVPEKDTAAGTAYEVRFLGNAGPEPRIIITGLSDRSKAQVVEGLAAGDRIVTAGQDALPSTGGGGGGTGMRRMGMGRL